MDDLSRGLEEKRAQLKGLVRRRAFESYMRYGRVPEAYASLTEIAEDEKKSLDVHRAAFSHKALGDARPTTHYIWRTARDERVRPIRAGSLPGATRRRRGIRAKRPDAAAGPNPITAARRCPIPHCRSSATCAPTPPASIRGPVSRH